MDSEEKDPLQDAIEGPIVPFMGREILGYCYKGRFGYFPHVATSRAGEAHESEAWNHTRCNHPRGGFRTAALALAEAVAAGERIIARDEYPDHTCYEEGGPRNLPKFRKLALTIDDADTTAESPRYFWEIREVIPGADGEREHIGELIAESRYPSFREYREAVVSGAAALKLLIEEDEGRRGG